MTHYLLTIAVLAPVALAAAEPFTIEDVTPGSWETGVSVEAAIQAHTSDQFDPSTLTEENVQLVGSNGKAVSVHVTGDLGGVITVSPNGRLHPLERYRLKISSGVRSADGRSLEPFLSNFVTGDLPPAPDRGGLPAWKKTLIDTPRGATAVELGPDGRLYLANWEGDLFRYDIDNATGKVGPRQRVWRVDGGRIIGLKFDPDASADDLVLWVGYDDRGGLDVDDLTFSGTLSRLQLPSGDGEASEQKVVVNLPNGDHPMNQFVFGPDGRVYVSMGAITMLGAGTDERHETPLSAAVVVADVRSPEFNGGRLPLDADTRPPVGYDPFAPDAPLRLFATGIREAYDLCWHSNGQLYAGINMNDTVQKSPESDRAPSISVRPDEPLLRIIDGAYYGQPNPTRNEWVVQGGNPTAGKDPWEITQYPVGVTPDSGFDPSLFVFNLAEIGGPSANGCAEWLGDGPMRGRLLIAFYTATRGVHTFTFSDDGTRVTDHQPLRDAEGALLQFGAPLDLVIDHEAARIYVADFADPRRGDSAKEGALWLVEADD